MNLLELSAAYDASASALRRRIWELRTELSCTRDPQQRWHIKQRIAELTPILTQMNELADLTAHYYERGYWRNEKYTV